MGLDESAEHWRVHGEAFEAGARWDGLCRLWIRCISHWQSRHANVLPIEANVHMVTLPCAPRVAASNRGHHGGLWREAAAVLAARAAAGSLCDLVAQRRRNDIQFRLGWIVHPPPVINQLSQKPIIAAIVILVCGSIAALERGDLMGNSEGCIRLSASPIGKNMPWGNFPFYFTSTLGGRDS